MFLPKIWNARWMVNDLKRKVYINKITTAIVTQEAVWNELIQWNWTWWCFKDYIDKFINAWTISNVNLIKDTPWNIAYWTKVWWCNWDFWIAKMKNWKYVVVWHLMSPIKWDFILDKTKYKENPYFINKSYIWDKIENKFCTSVKKWSSNIQCDIKWWKSIWEYVNPDLDIYAEVVWY